MSAREAIRQYPSIRWASMQHSHNSGVCSAAVGGRGRRTFIASTGYMTVCSCEGQYLSGVGEGRRVKLTAIPANAPATMFCTREKFGGRDS